MRNEPQYDLARLYEYPTLYNESTYDYDTMVKPLEKSIKFSTARGIICEPLEICLGTVRRAGIRAAHYPSGASGRAFRRDSFEVWRAVISHLEAQQEVHRERSCTTMLAGCVLVQTLLSSALLSAPLAPRALRSPSRPAVLMQEVDAPAAPAAPRPSPGNSLPTLELTSPMYLSLIHI